MLVLQSPAHSCLLDQATLKDKHVLMPNKLMVNDPIWWIYATYIHVQDSAMLQLQTLFNPLKTSPENTLW